MSTLSRNISIELVSSMDSVGALSSQPQHPIKKAFQSGVQWPLGNDKGNPALYVPDNLPAGPVPLVVLLHGATSNPLYVLPTLQESAEQQGFLVLAPASAGFTWDAIRNGFGPDVAQIDQALEAVFDHFPVDPARISIAGFSDGATYALTLGLANGDLFRRIIAFSPGFVAPARRTGQPHIFISHGTDDSILPVEHTSRRIVPALRDQGYDVDYREFIGGHEIPRDIISTAVALLS